MPTEALDESLLEMFNDLVTVEIFTGVVDKYGKSGFGSPLVDLPARIDASVRAVRTATGEEAISTLQVYVLSTAQHTVEDRLTLPRERVPASPAILLIEPVQDERGQTMVVFYT